MAKIPAARREASGLRLQVEARTPARNFGERPGLARHCLGCSQHLHEEGEPEERPEGDDDDPEEQAGGSGADHEAEEHITS